MNKVLTIREDSVIIDENVLAIKEFRNMFDFYKTRDEGKEENAIKAFTYLHFMYDPESPYLFMPEEDREASIKKDFKGAFNPAHDQVFLDAEEKMKKLCESPISRLLNALKVSLDKMSLFLVTEEIQTGKDGNAATILSMHNNAAKLAQNFNAIEADFRKEVSKSRGNSRKAIDADDQSDLF